MCDKTQKTCNNLKYFKTMKRHLSLLTLGLIAALSVGCGPTIADKAAKWVAANTDHVVCFNPENPTLYYFVTKKQSVYSDSYLKATIDEVVKVDLKNDEAGPLAICVDGDYNPAIKYYLIPEDKGYDNPNPSFVLSTSDTGVLYNANTEQFTTICKGDILYVYGNHLICCSCGNSFYSTGFNDISAYDATGTKLQEYRTFVGSIAKQDVVVDLYIGADGSIFGSYYYAKYAKNGKTPERLLLDGYVGAGNYVFINGYNIAGSRTETWTGILSNGTITAEFENLYTGRTYDFVLVEQK